MTVEAIVQKGALMAGIDSSALDRDPIIAPPPRTHKIPLLCCHRTNHASSPPPPPFSPPPLQAKC